MCRLLICCQLILVLATGINSKQQNVASEDNDSQDYLLPNNAGKAKFYVFYHAGAPSNDEALQRFDELTVLAAKEEFFAKQLLFERHRCGSAKKQPAATGRLCEAVRQNAQPIMALMPATATVPEDIVQYPGLMRTDNILNYLRQALKFSNSADTLRRTRYAVQPQAERLQPEELEDRIARFHQASFFVMFYDDPRMLHLWDRMALEFFGQEYKATFIAVNCSYSMDGGGDVQHRAGLCQEFAPNISTTFCAMHWFRGAKNVYKYEAAWTPYDLVKFVNIIGKDNKDIINRTEPANDKKDSRILREAKDDTTGLYKEVQEELDKRYAKHAIDVHEGLNDLTRHNFAEQTTKGGAHLVFFYTPWDVWSHELSFALVETAAKFLNDGDVFIDRVDCYKHGAACHEFNFTSYPQLVWMAPSFTDALISSTTADKKPQPQAHIAYQYQYHTFDEVERFVRTMKRFANANRSPHSILSTQLFAERIGDKDDYNTKSNNVNTYILLYTQYGCRLCLEAMPYWEAAAHELQSHRMQQSFPVQLLNNGGLRVGKLDCADGDNINFCMEKFKVNSYPAIILDRPRQQKQYIFQGNRSSVHQLVQFALRSLDAYNVDASDGSAEGGVQRPLKDTAKNYEDDEAHKKSTTTVAPPVHDDKTTVQELVDDDIDMIKVLDNVKDFDRTIKSGLSIVMLENNDCPLCQQLRKPLNRLAFGLDFIPRILSGDITVATVNCNADLMDTVCTRYISPKNDHETSPFPSVLVFYNGNHLGKLGGTTHAQFMSDLMSIVPLPKLEL